MKIYEAVQNQFIISTDKSKLNLQFIHNYLSNESYWAKKIPEGIVKKSIGGSCCFGLFVKENVHASKQNIRQVGFARVVTDHATIGYLADVFIIDECRGRGRAKCPPG